MGIVYTLEKDRFEEFKRHLKKLGFKFESRPHQVFLARYDKFTVNLYESGKITFGGSDKIINEVEWFLRNRLGAKPSGSPQGIGFEGKTRIGTDEAGKGDFFGPLVVAGVLVTPDTESMLMSTGVRDSKLVRSEQSISKIAGAIKRLLGKDGYDIVSIHPARYNELYEKLGNLNSMLGWAHARAIENLLRKNEDCRLAIADQFGNEEYIRKALMSNGKKIELIQAHKGERDSAVAAASIVARDRFLFAIRKLSEEFDVEFPRGSGDKARYVAGRFIEEYGKEALRKVAKLHFSLSNELL
ncbi:MAG: ribonuclease HIII [Thermoplasmata archaeon]